VAAVDLAPVPGLDDQDEKVIIIDCVKHPVIVGDTYA
jgi:hypothetical protein